MSDPGPGVDEQKVIGQETTAPKTKTEQEKDKAAEDYSQVDANGTPSMRVRVRSPFRDYFDGQAFSVTAENATGPFDILPRHHSFISLLLPCELIIRPLKGGEQKIRISGGIMHVKADEIIVFLDV